MAGADPVGSLGRITTRGAVGFAVAGHQHGQTIPDGAPQHLSGSGGITQEPQGTDRPLELSHCRGSTDTGTFR